MEAKIVLDNSIEINEIQNTIFFKCEMPLTIVNEQDQQSPYSSYSLCPGWQVFHPSEHNEGPKQQLPRLHCSCLAHNKSRSPVLS